MTLGRALVLQVGRQSSRCRLVELLEERAASSEGSSQLSSSWESTTHPPRASTDLVEHSQGQLRVNVTTLDQLIQRLEQGIA